MDEWVDGWMEMKTHRWTDGCLDDRWKKMNKCVNKLMSEMMNNWMDRYIQRHADR